MSMAEHATTTAALMMNAPAGLTALCNAALELLDLEAPLADLASGRMDGTPGYDAIDQAARLLENEAERLAGQVALLPARTKEDMALKARVWLGIRTALDDYDLDELGACLAHGILASPEQPSMPKDELILTAGRILATKTPPDNTALDELGASLARDFLASQVN